MNEQPGKHPITGKPQGRLKRGGNEGNVYGAGKKTNAVFKKSRTLAISLVAIGEKTFDDIAKECGIGADTFLTWRKDPEFIAAVDRAKEEVRQTILKTGIADRVERVRRLNKRFDGLNQVFEERGADPTHQDVPGWSTGLLCHEQKGVGSGPLAEVVDVYKVDAGAIREERELAKQAAQELGQWTEKVQNSFDLSNLTDEELDVLERIQSKLTAKP